MEAMKIQCIDCSNEFEVSTGEQEFYKSKGFELPKRCKECRAKKKAQRSEGGDR